MVVVLITNLPEAGGTKACFVPHTCSSTWQPRWIREGCRAAKLRVHYDLC